MRKIFYIFVLMVSSFFVFNTNVRAVESFTFIIDEQDFAYINDDFINVRNLAIDYANKNNKYYIITYSGNYFVHFVDSDNYPFEIYQNTRTPRILIDNSSVEKYKFDSGILKFSSSTDHLYLPFYDSSYINRFHYRNFLDTNLYLVYSNTGGHNITITYNDFSYSITGYEDFPTLLEIYEDIYGPIIPEQPEEPSRNESLDSFYYLIMEKIELFANYFITNSTLLFIIGIIILIFIIELIFRRIL